MVSTLKRILAGNKFISKPNNMKKLLLTYTITTLLLTSLLSCSNNIVQLTKEHLTPVNREIVAIDKATNTVILNNKVGDGMAIIKNIPFDAGTIELDLKGENIQQKSFLGIAFNIQNDSTYEAIYFRPFNFQAEEKLRREHSIQYIYHPNYNWSFLRTNFEGKYEAAFPRRPSPDEWFKVLLKITASNVYVYDSESNTEILSVERLTKQKSDTIAFWAGNDSKGQYRNLKIKK